MATFVRHEACPSCGSRDNLGRYSDGSAWCFGCHHVELADSAQTLSSIYSLPLKEQKDVQPPLDLCFDFPRYVVEWLARYDISIPEAMKYGWKYSPYYDQLVFLFYEEGEVVFYQARNFRQGSRSKYFNVGEKETILPVFQAPTVGMAVRRLVITEDVVSAARIARQSDAMPCLGSNLPVKKITALRGSYESMLVWLDHDKYREAREIADKAKWLGMSARALYTELDPKEYTDEAIAGYLKENT